jgi:UDP-N-acetylmuramoyl-tripeptide--D-alanyl-D-alanine ligase
MITVLEIIKVLSKKNIPAFEIPITKAVIDSRKVIPGSLFIALKGEKTDGHQFIENAFKNGASIALISNEISQDEYNVIDLRSTSKEKSLFISDFPLCIYVDDSLAALQKIAKYWRMKLQLRVTGITGSVGKSSTKELVAEVLSHEFHTFKNPGNYNNEIGLPLTILNLGSGYEQLVLEMGFYYPGEISFLCNISKPDNGVITNVGTVHAERAGSQQAIANGKSELVVSLPNTPKGTAILNYDDLFVREMAARTKAKVLFYGLDPNAHLWADEIQGKGLKGIRFKLHYQGKSTQLDVPILGRHSVQTVLRASAVGFAEGLTMEQVSDGLITSNSQLRLVAVRTQSGALLLDDTYNATPESTIAALNLLSELSGQKIAVLGDMLELGQYEEIGHKNVGIQASKVVNYLIAVGPRGRLIAESAKEEGLPSTAVTCVDNAVEAAELLQYHLKSDDVVLIKGSHGLRMDRISSLLEAGI